MRSRLDPVTVERLLARLGLRETPPVSVEGLHALYRAWCRHVPFDNVLRRIHLAYKHPGPLPGFDPAAFVQTYLRYGAGGTCTPSSGGLHVLLCSLGFTIERVLAMMGAEDEPLTLPNHTALLVRLDGATYLVDTSIACEQALPLRATRTVLDDPLHPATTSPVMGTWRIRWVRPFNGQRLQCQLLPSPATTSGLLQVYEATRGSGAFNAALYARLNVEGGIVVVAKAKRFAIDRIGHAQATVVGEARTRVLVEEMGFSEELVAQLPPDVHEVAAPVRR